MSEQKITIEQQLQHLKDIRAVLQSIKKQAVIPNAADYRATNRDSIERQLSVGTLLVQTLIDDVARQAREDEEEQAKYTAIERVSHDMPYVQVDAVRVYQYHERSGRWYIEVDITHPDEEQGKARVLCHVGYDAEGHLSAQRIDIADRE